MALRCVQRGGLPIQHLSDGRILWFRHTFQVLAATREYYQFDGPSGRTQSTARSRKSGIDPVSGWAYHVAMAEVQQSESKARIDNLASQVEELIQVCERLKAENDSLRTQQQVLTTERAKLIEKNELARTRVEAMITRLKAMEMS